MIGVHLDTDTLDWGDVSFAELEKHFSEWRAYKSTALSEVVERLEGATVAITTKAPLTADALSQLPALKLIISCATGTDHLDVKTARALGITVCNVPGYATEAVANQAVALVLTLALALPQYDTLVKTGQWAKCTIPFLKGPTPKHISDLKVGLIGKGAIGTAFEKRMTALGATVSSFNRHAYAQNERRAALLDWLGVLDVVSLHCPANEETRNIVDRDFLQHMKADAMLINTARGILIDEEALVAHLKAVPTFKVGMDVLAKEPPLPNHPLEQFGPEQVIITPHTSWAATSVRIQLLKGVEENVRGFLAGTPCNEVG